MRLSLVTPPKSEPVSLSEAKAHLRVTHDAEDALISGLIVAAREAAEEMTGRQIGVATWRLTLDGFPSGVEAIELPKPPLVEVESIVYDDGSGVEQTWDPDEYIVATYDGPFAPAGQVYPRPGYCYPATANRPGSVRITFRAGSEDAPPEGLRSLMLLLVGDLYEHREAQIIGTSVVQSEAVRRLSHLFRYSLVG